MKLGPNLVYMVREDEGLALVKQLLTTFKINDYRIFLILPCGKVQFIHIKDCVLPKKVNTGRVTVVIQFSIENNSNTSQIKFIETETFEA